MWQSDDVCYYVAYQLLLGTLNHTNKYQTIETMMKLRWFSISSEDLWGFIFICITQKCSYKINIFFLRDAMYILAVQTLHYPSN